MVTPEFKAPMVAEAVKYLAFFCVVGTVTAENSVKNTEHDKKVDKICDQKPPDPG